MRLLVKLQMSFNKFPGETLFCIVHRTPYKSVMFCNNDVGPLPSCKIRTVARKFSIGGFCVSAVGLDILKIDKNPTDL